MDWTELIGRPRPAEPDALRLMAVVHQLGEARPSGDGRNSGESQSGGDGQWRLEGEQTLLQLDHLVRRPRLLAHLLMHLFDVDPSWVQKRATVSRRVRQLIELEERRGARQRRRGTLGASLDFPALAPWRRLDDSLAALSMRGLLDISLDSPADSGADPGADPEADSTVPAARQLVYTLRQSGARLLEDHFYTEAGDAARQLEVSGVIREFLPRWDGPWLRSQLEEAQESVMAFRYAEQIPLERPVLPEIFLLTFDERL